MDQNNSETSRQEKNRPKVFALVILIILVIVNAIWAAATRMPGAAVNVILYVLITYFFWHNDHYNTGITGGILASLLHLSELIRGAWVFEGVTPVMLILNIVLPILLVYFSFRAKKKLTPTVKSVFFNISYQLFYKIDISSF